ncbi:MAG: dCMP deaminase family protein [Acinetobacter sp.]
MDRPNKVEYFMSLALLAAQRASCPRRKVGCVLVNGDYHVVSTGYNGPPKNVPNCTDVPCGGHNQPSGQGLSLCKAVHAEINAIEQAGNRLHTVTDMYLTAGPCCEFCTDTIVKLYSQGALSGLKRLYYFDKYPAGTHEIFESLGIELIHVDQRLDTNGMLFNLAVLLGFRQEIKPNNQVLCVGGALHGSLVTCKGNYLRADPSHCIPEELNQLYRFEGATIAKDVIEPQQYYRVIYRQNKWQRFEIMRFNELTDEQFSRLLIQLKINNPQEFMP